VLRLRVAPPLTNTCCSVVAGASRTDAGAHATGAIAHLDVVGSPESIEPASLMMAMNGVLPPEVKVQALELAPPGQAC
jgi:tRNA U38,U39,U40 pseudouridine synthase TruA